MPNDFLLEIGTEEIPARFMGPALTQLRETAEKALRDAGLGFSEARTLGTPRRLALLVKGLEDHQPDRESEVTGMSWDKAFDAEGKPTKGLEGFCRGKGVSLEQVYRKEVEKGTVVAAKLLSKGRPTKDLLQEWVPQWITALNFPKSMRWLPGDRFRFARAIRWLVVLYGTDVVPCSVAGISSGRITRGHRFLGRPSISLGKPGEYPGALAANRVMTDPEERRQRIQSESERMAREAGGSAILSEALLETLVYLVEYPMVFLGTFDSELLQLPAEVLMASMINHQKYIPIKNTQGRLVNAFISVSNGSEVGRDNIIHGNERVLKARLSDAMFFYQEDLKRPLPSFREELKGRLFHQKLGSMAEKASRLERLAPIIFCALYPGKCADGAEWTREAAALCKVDLATQMVGEFPELQGIMGGNYALKQEFPVEVAQAIGEHYRPAFREDRLPDTPVGTALALADKVDSLAGMFGAGLEPTGSEDPFALRRAALGILRMLLEGNLRGNVKALLKEAVKGFENQPFAAEADKLTARLWDFLLQRLKVLLGEQGWAYDFVEAALAAPTGDVVDLLRRGEALRHFAQGEAAFESLAVAFKRVIRIIPAGFEPRPVNADLLTDAPEQILFDEYVRHKEMLGALLHRGDYQSFLREAAGLKPAIDGFFDKVLVMAEDEVLRANRLSLLAAIRGQFLEFLDFSKLEV